MILNIQSLKTKTNEFFFEESKNVSYLVFFRVSIALFLIVHFLSSISDFDKIYGPNGIVPLELQKTLYQNFYFNLEDFHLFFKNIFNFTIFESELLFKSFYLIFSFAILIGFYTRIVSILLLFLQLILINGSWMFVYGVDQFAIISIFYLIIFPPIKSFSILSNFKLVENDKSHPIIFLRLIQIHLSLIYLFSGIDKAIGYNWWNGESFWKALHILGANYDFEINIDWLANYPALLSILGILVVLTEFLYVFFIWIKSTSKYFLVIIILFHLFIAIFLNLYFFAVIMILWNLTGFYFNKNQISYEN